ncbi:MAG TPA: hypothetical protein VFE58_19225 [Tepidisphaeraceae bacterium]|nr:hypothetical protein [Tepidisphaeraceae bacterium]
MVRTNLVARSISASEGMGIVTAGDVEASRWARGTVAGRLYVFDAANAGGAPIKVAIIKICSERYDMILPAWIVSISWLARQNVALIMTEPGRSRPGSYLEIILTIT